MYLDLRWQEPIHIATGITDIIFGFLVGPVEFKEGHPFGIHKGFSHPEGIIFTDRAFKFFSLYCSF
jgi:hypothetical protein